MSRRPPARRLIRPVSRSPVTLEHQPSPRVFGQRRVRPRPLLDRRRGKPDVTGFPAPEDELRVGLAVALVGEDVDEGVGHEGDEGGDGEEDVHALREGRVAAREEARLAACRGAPEMSENGDAPGFASLQSGIPRWELT